MKTILELFEEVCAIPHCSGQSGALKEYIIHVAQSCGYEIQVDGVGNILASSKEAKLTLQAHYDMVCMGRAPNIELIYDKEVLRAKESSLGADNGIGVAMMLKAMLMGLEVDLLFTADEEIGLVGATHLELKISTPYVLNLDTEEEGAVFIGCAGGKDMQARKKVSTQSSEAELFSLRLDGLPGGHSGVDIDKNIPNAILELLKRLKNAPIHIVSFKGGERHNAIAKAAEVTYIKRDKNFIVEGERSLGCKRVQSIESSQELTAFLSKLPHGIQAYNQELKIAQSSMNLAFLDIGEGVINITYSLRAMDDASMALLFNDLKWSLQTEGFSIKSEAAYPAWKPEINDFSRKVAQSIESYLGAATFKAIHAGLECGVLKSYARHAKFASVGPNIFYPHSTREYVELSSIERFEKIVLDIISAL